MCLCLCLAGAGAAAEVTYRDWDQPPHRYFERTPSDRFSRLKSLLESGQTPLDRSGERAFLVSLLQLLEIPESSQMLVFSTTSLQLRLISPSNPRALYFNEEVYVGYIPGGRIEIVSVDPELGGVFHILDVPKGAETLKIERSTRCMNCHASDNTGFVPGLAIKSVVPGPSGGSLDSFRREQTGHGVPLADRFGGWYVTGSGGFTNHWGNLIGELSAGGVTKIPVAPGQRFDFSRYLVATSDLLPQLVHEHQAGFVNRVVEAAYRARTYLHADGEPEGLTKEHQEDLDQQARTLARYLLFADEVPLPAGGVSGDPRFKADFLRNRRAVNGASLKDFDLGARLFRNRCSYMIYTDVFMGLPSAIQDRVWAQLDRALDLENPDPEYAYLPAEEKRRIRVILRGTVAKLPPGW
ncbi:MAG: hypothetical protein KIT22_18455 [Verrucomicrobiae bacterium]|nr:hypothetical protein [Verrucomicrobiae bacterium]